jgi:Mrp family chromosome partitioning ATPase
MRERLDAQYQKVALELAEQVRASRMRSVVFVSPTSGQGTSTTVLSVARQLKISCGINPLVVELNRRRPSFVRLLDLDESKSVAAIANGSSSQDCVQHIADGLSVIPVGDFHSLRSRGDCALIDAVNRIQGELKGAYPIIIWDAAPVLEAPDVRLLRGVLPNVVLIVESGRSSHEVLERVNDELAEAGITLQGTVMVKQNRPIPSWIYRWLID